jgi:hypothetical protein
VRGGGEGGRREGPTAQRIAQPTTRRLDEDDVPAGLDDDGAGGGGGGADHARGGQRGERERAGTHPCCCDGAGCHDASGVGCDAPSAHRRHRRQIQRQMFGRLQPWLLLPQGIVPGSRDQVEVPLYGRGMVHVGCELRLPRQGSAWLVQVLDTDTEPAVGCQGWILRTDVGGHEPDRAGGGQPLWRLELRVAGLLRRAAVCPQAGSEA